LRLPTTMVIEGNVNLPLYAGIYIPSCFPVANGQNTCDFHAREFKGRQETLMDRWWMCKTRQIVQNSTVVLFSSKPL